MSAALIICVIVLALVVIIGATCVTYRVIKIRHLPKWRMAEGSSSSTEGPVRITAPRYTDLRDNGSVRRDSQLSQACILGMPLP